MYLNSKKGFKPGTIIMLHGSSSSSRIYDPIFKSDIENSLISFDFYGHGKSERNGKYGMEDLKAQLLSVLEKVHEDVILIGHSLGGHIAMESAMQINNLKALLVFGSPPVKIPLNIEEAFNAISEMNTFFTPQPSNEDIDKAIARAAVNKEVYSEIKDDFINTEPDARAILSQQLDKYSDELEILHRLKCKKYILNGSKDPVSKIDYLETSSEYGGYELIHFDNSGHYPSIEEPKKFAQLVKSIAQSDFV